MEAAREAALRTQLLDRRDRLKKVSGVSRHAQQMTQLLRDVDAALERMDARTYGVCVVCREPIEEEHLRLDPLVCVCLSHLSEEQQRAVERDLELAAVIQNRLLPPQHLRTGGWEVFYRYEPAGPVSGDYCDFLTPEATHGDAFFACGDVSGKGVAGSLLMSHLQAIFRTLIPTGLSLNSVVERANRLFCESTLSTHFATLVCGKAAPSGDVEICNAGHQAPLIIRGGRLTRLEGTSLPMGVFQSSQYPAEQVHLGQGDTLVLYTDGITETRNSGDTEYGEERLANLITRNHASSPQELIKTCLDDLVSFRAGAPKHDDVTIMILRRVA